MSGFLKLNLVDLGKGVIVAAGTVFFTGLGNILSTGALPTLQALGAIALTGVSAGLAYLMKNLFTNSSGMIATPEKSTK